MDERITLFGVQITVLAAFLAGYGGSNLALPSFGFAVIGTIVFGYGILAGED